MTNNKLTDEKLAVFTKPPENWPCPGSAGDIMAMAIELQERRKVDDAHQHLSELYHAQEKRLFKLAQRIKGPSFDKYAYSPSQAIDVLESAVFGGSTDTDHAAELQERRKDAGLKAFLKEQGKLMGQMIESLGGVIADPDPESAYAWQRETPEADNAEGKVGMGIKLTYGQLSELLEIAKKNYKAEPSLIQRDFYIATIVVLEELQERRKADNAPGDFLSRMRDELHQLRTRSGGLHAFIGTPSFKALGDSARAAMLRQLDVMSEYIEILHHRIRLAEDQ